MVAIYSLQRDGDQPGHQYVELDDGLIAERYTIIGTVFVRYELWARDDQSIPHRFQTITHEPQFGGWLGAVTSERLPREIDALPYGAHRVQMVTAHLESVRLQCEERIRATFPDDFTEEQFA